MRLSTALTCYIVLAFALSACSTSTPAAATATSLFATAGGTLAATEAPVGETNAAPIVTVAPTSSASGFTVAVVVDTTTEQVTREQAQAVVEQASKFVREFSPIGLSMVDFTEDGTGGPTGEMANRYMSTHAAALPNGIVIFSKGDNGRAKSEGGYGYAVPAPPGFKNRFISPVAGEGVMYVAVVDYVYRYMECGYGGSESVQSSTSLPGECGGQTGLACVMQNGYSMCSNALGHLYTMSPTYAVSSMVVHGLLHNFGPNGDKDHYTTPECSARMGYPPGFYDLQQSQYYNGLCPYLYEDFTKAYRP
ncbi:MAG: hypothetical protein ACM3MF_04925 [Anaerolineae bacterium]